MIWLWFEEMLRAASTRQMEAAAARPPYTGPLRRRTDPIEVEARLIDDRLMPAPHRETPP